MTLRKNPTLALEILDRLQKIDSRYHLSVCGMGGEPLALETFIHLGKRLNLQHVIRWEGKIPLSDMPMWHRANGVLLHTSLHEAGLSYAVLEAAASGSDLAVFDHPGVPEGWPRSMLFSRVDEAVALVCNAVSGRWRAYVCEQHSLDQQIRRIADVLNRSIDKAC